MIIVHNLILRCANSIYLQCLNVEKSPAVIPDFVGYTRLWGLFGERSRPAFQGWARSDEKDN